MWEYKRKSIFLSIMVGMWLLFAFSGQFGCGKDPEPSSENKTEATKTEMKKEVIISEQKNEVFSDKKEVPKLEESLKKEQPVEESITKVEPKIEPIYEPIIKDVVEPSIEAQDAGSEPIIDTLVLDKIPENGGPTPTVKIKEPAQDEIVKCSINIKVDVTVSGGAKIDKVELLIDGKKAQNTTNAPYDFIVDTKTLTDGVHKITAIAYTTWGKKAQDEISIKVANFGPKITFVKPLVNATVNAKFDIEVTVSDVIGVKAGTVKLAIDGVSIPWTSTNPSYKASFDPLNKPFDSLPIVVSAENIKGVKSEKILWVLHVLSTGTKKNAEECDNSDPTKRCIANFACLNLGGKGSKSLCYPMCTVGSKTDKCAPVIGKNIRCQAAWQGMTKGVCLVWTPPSGALYSKCGGTITCTNPKHTCVGATGSGVSYCLEKCSGAGGTCSQPGFFCAPLSSGGGACIEKCEQKCKTDAECSQGQTCTSGVCTGSFCANYGACVTFSGLPHKICI